MHLLVEPLDVVLILTLLLGSLFFVLFLRQRARRYMRDGAMESADLIDRQADLLHRLYHEGRESLSSQANLEIREYIQRMRMRAARHRLNASKWEEKER